jgi:COX assembly protein 2
MTALDECHARGFLHKALGNCNDIKRDVNRCLAGERYARAKRNRDEAREKKKRIERIWAEERGLEAGTGGLASVSAGSAGTAQSAEKQ